MHKSNSSKYKKLDRAKSPHSVDNLQFPIDVDSDPGLGNHGHYMMFYINQQNHAKLKFGDPAEPKQDGKKNITKAMEELNVDKQENVVTKEAQYAQTNITGEKVKVKEAQFGLRANTNSVGKYGLNTDSSNQDKLGFEMITGANAQVQIKASMSKEAQAIHVERAATTRMKTAIALFMPASVQVQYGANYTDTEIGSMAERAAKQIRAFSKVMLVKEIRTILDADKTLLENAGQFLLAGIGNIPGFGGAKELESMKKTDFYIEWNLHLRVSIKGHFNIQLIALLKESDEIKVHHAFKFNMLPEY